MKKGGPRISAACFLGPKIHPEDTSVVYGPRDKCGEVFEDMLIQMALRDISSTTIVLCVVPHHVMVGPPH